MKSMVFFQKNKTKTIGNFVTGRHLLISKGLDYAVGANILEINNKRCTIAIGYVTVFSENK